MDTFGLKLFVLALVLNGECVGIVLVCRNRETVPVHRAPPGTLGSQPRDGPLLLTGNLFEMVALGTMTLITNVPVPPVLMFIGIGIAFILSLAGLAVFGTAIRRRMAATSHD